MTALAATLGKESPRLRLRSEEPTPSLPARCERFFLAWLVLRTLIWAVVAALQPNPPLDTVEWLCWGRHWQLGYHKHPPLGAWLGELGCWLTPGSIAGGCLTGYLCVALALWSVWRLARALLPPRPALAATLCLDGLVFLGPASAEYSNYMPHIGFWALSVWLFHRAFTGDRTADWLLAGLAGGLALLSKYSTALLLVCLAGYWLVYHRRGWRGPLLAMLVMTVVCLPHLLWLIANDFPTQRWVVLRGQGDSGAFDHHAAGLLFLVSQGLRLVPVFVILLPLFWRAGAAGMSPGGRFLLVAVLGPVLLHVAASVFAGLQLRDGWGAPLWTFVGLMLLVLVRADDTDQAWRRFLVTWAVVAVAFLVAFVLTTFASHWPLRVHFPGRALAHAINDRYSEQVGRPPAIIAGDWWLAGNVCLHSTDRPRLFGSLEPSSDRLTRGRKPIRTPGRYYVPDPLTSPWTSDRDLFERGGVLVWDAAAFGEALPVELRERYPGARTQPAIELPYLGGMTGTVQVGWAIIVPGERGVSTP